MKKILVPIDFSEDTMMISRYALELARPGASEICLMHSFFDRMVATESSFPGNIEGEILINEQLLIENKEKAAESIAHLQDTLLKVAEEENISNLNITTYLAGSEPCFEILDHCKTFNPYIIIMGTRGKGNKGFLEGSVSQKLMNNANVPVLAIPSIETFKGYSKVLYLSNFDDYDVKAINLLLNLTRIYNSQITVLHLVKDNNAPESKDKLDQLRAGFLEEEEKGYISFLLKEKTDYRQDVLDFTMEHNIGLISFIPHKRTFLDGFFRSVMTKKDLYKTNLPLLAIPCKDC